MAFVHDDSETMTLSNYELRLKFGARVNCEAPVISEHFVAGAGAIDSWVPQLFDVTDTGGATVYAPSGTAVGGAIVAVTGGVTNNGEEIGGKLIGWQPSTQALQAPLVFEAVVKAVGATTATDGDLGIGFADAITYTNSLPYVVSAASAITTSVPSEFAGFWYSSIATSGALFVTGGNPYGMITTIVDVDTVTAPDTSNRVIKNSNYHRFRVEIDSAGNAKFFVDRKFQAYVALAVTAATKFTPYIVGIAKNSHTNTVTVDSWFVAGDSPLAG